MVHFDGKDYKKIALHGGGCPMLGHCIGLFETLKWFEDFKSLNISFITSSAGSLAILYFIVKIKDKNKDMSHIFSKLKEESENVLSNLDQISVVSFEFVDNFFSTDLECVYNMTFKDLNEINPNFEWTICCSKYDNFELSLQTYGTHTPDVLIWKACVASAALPVVFPPIEINGFLNCDGDLSNWVEELDIIDDESILHIGSHISSSKRSTITGLMLIDEFLDFSKCCFFKMMKKKAPIHGVNRIEFCGTVLTDFLSEEYIESGKLMADKFVLK
uniref:PNPLA domain-containing protein n=1 Tax=viral metagenome TaxID=1070528 RepID=A0A6C0J2Y2_9ZZZZ